MQDSQLIPPIVLSPALRCPGKVPRGFVLDEMVQPVDRRFPAYDRERLRLRTKTIRTCREKFIWRSDEAHELYDVLHDSHETHSLIEQDADRGDALRRMLFDWRATTESSRAALGADDDGAGMRGQLQRLGEME